MRGGGDGDWLEGTGGGLEPGWGSVVGQWGGETGEGRERGEGLDKT